MKISAYVLYVVTAYVLVCTYAAINTIFAELPTWSLRLRNPYYYPHHLLFPQISAEFFGLAFSSKRSFSIFLDFSNLEWIFIKSDVWVSGLQQN